MPQRRASLWHVFRPKGAQRAAPSGDTDCWLGVCVCVCAYCGYTWVNGRRLNDGQVRDQFAVSLLSVIRKELLGVEFLGFAEWLKLNFCGRQRLIRKGSLHSVEVVCSNGHKSALATYVFVQFVLQSDEALVPSLIKGDVSEHCAHHIGPYGFRLLGIQDQIQ